ncbi:MAG: hypothetical protein ACYCOX_18425 [Acidobacteriaceae bacterium]
MTFTLSRQEPEKNQRLAFDQSRAIAIDPLLKIWKILTVTLERIVRYREAKRPCVDRKGTKLCLDLFLIPQITEWMAVKCGRWIIGKSAG